MKLLPMLTTYLKKCHINIFYKLTVILRSKVFNRKKWGATGIVGIKFTKSLA